MKIRKAAPGDAGTIARFNLALAKETESEELDYRTVLKGVKALLADESKGFYIVAEERDAIIGQLMVTHEWSDWRNGDIWWLQSLYVDRAWRRRGVFRHLFRELRRRAAKEGVRLIRLYVHEANLRAHKVY
ncbi:MAG: GNAT family N-acetyltransferase [Thermoplasmatota archaeon]